MLQLTRFRNLLFLLPAGLVLTCILVTYSELFLQETSILSNAITFDLLVTTPFLYFLIIRKRAIPKTTIIPVFILGIVVASLILPKGHQEYLQYATEWFLPLLELGVMTYLFITIRKAIRIAKSKKDTSLDFHELATYAGSQLFSPRLGPAVATELSMLYYGLLSWKKHQMKADEFSYHKTTSTRLLLVVFIFLVIIETVAVHVALAHWSTVAAWILTAISGYTAIQMLGIAKSISRRMIVVGTDALKLRWGFMQESEIQMDEIKSVSLHKQEVEKASGTAFLSPFQSAEGHNVLIELNEEACMTKLYGFKTHYTKIFVYLDEPESFVNRINARDLSVSEID